MNYTTQTVKRNNVTYTVKVLENGNKYWLNEEGQLDNERGPAVEWADGYKVYYSKGKRHKTDGPAVRYADGSKEYWLNDKLNRTDGPAIEYASGNKYYYLNGKRYSYEEWKKEVENIN